ncbi:phospholipase A [Ramlibacter sp. MMS24-I3-19]|uniref:phospholipase A n=1 Tax=Ramlibacter sp. MMS24-I3-19 TaxID=3416606 RepID=UPI003D082575
MSAVAAAAGSALVALAWAAPLPAAAQGAAPADGWQACAALADADARLACYDQWAGRARPGPVAAPEPSPAPTPKPGDTARVEPPGNDDTAPGGCHDSAYSELSRFWELERATGCGVFGIRSYRPISLSVIGSDSVNRQPTSENPLNNAAAPLPYRTTETRIQLSVRTKLAEGLLTQGAVRDSVWFGYTQQSSWQLFTGGLSRPFRNTDHEPEFVYAYPFQLPALQGWRLRYGGLGLVHQSNGQSLPLSRSWNRVYLMAGADRGSFTLQGRVWQRINEQAADDDNPRISDYVGRAEATGSWHLSDGEMLSFTVRHSLRAQAHGSLRLEWMLPIGDTHGSRNSAMRLHTQLFSGYGDSLLDYNRRRTVLSLGLSLVDW